MVLIHYKKTDHNQFLYEVKGDRLVAQIVDELVLINNHRIQLDIFACAIEDLAQHGPLKPEQIRGLTDPELVQNALIISPDEKKKWAIPRIPEGDQRFNQDKTHYRIGVIKNQNITKMMKQTSIKAKKLISYKNVDEKIRLQPKALQQMWQELKGALAIAYPGFVGLGQWQPAKQISLGQYYWEDVNTNQIDYLDPKSSTIWWAGKELFPDKPLNSFVGKNEKTKILVKLTKKGSGAPCRQPSIDEETKLKLMSMYHRKQQQLKNLKTNNDQQFVNSTWANPNNLKSYLVTGNQGIKFK